jgi:hypothetical protein
MDTLIPEDVYDRDLYHYTSSQGLLGMLKSGKIWCSHIFYLNDFEENLNAWNIFYQVLDSYDNGKSDLQTFKNIINGSFGDRRKNFSELTNQDFKTMQMEEYRYFVFSLSLVKDDLSQWRSYTPDSSGFCVHFKFNKNLRDGLPHHFICALAKCIYKDTEKKVKIAQLLDSHYEDFTKNKSYWDIDLFFSIINLNLFFKNETFSSEQECRLVIQLTKGSDSLINVRTGKSFLVPYIELKDIALPFIKGITIGPTPFPYHSKDALKIHLKNSGLTIDDPEISKIPYRSW